MSVSVEIEAGMGNMQLTDTLLSKVHRTPGPLGRVCYYKDCRACKLYYPKYCFFFFLSEKEAEVMLITLLVPLQPQDMERAL